MLRSIAWTAVLLITPLGLMSCNSATTSSGSEAMKPAMAGVSTANAKPEVREQEACPFGKTPLPASYTIQKPSAQPTAGEALLGKWAGRWQGNYGFCTALIVHMVAGDTVTLYYSYGGTSNWSPGFTEQEGTFDGHTLTVHSGSGETRITPSGGVLNAVYYGNSGSYSATYTRVE